MARVDPLTYEEGLAILMRDRFKCHYCGLDGTKSFDNALMMTVDFVLPRAEGGTKDPENLVAACRACNVIKGKRTYGTFENAKDYVMRHREQRRREWQEHMEALGVAASPSAG